MSDENMKLTAARNFEAEFYKKHEELCAKTRECEKLNQKIKTLEQQVMYLAAVKDTAEAFLGRKIGGNNEPRKAD
jgi:hypothetical protein